MPEYSRKHFYWNLKSLTRNVRVQRKDHSLILRPCIQRQVDQLLSASCPWQVFTMVNNSVIHPWCWMESNHKTLLEKIKSFTRNRRGQRKDHSLLLRPCLQRQVHQLLSASCSRQVFTKVNNVIHPSCLIQSNHKTLL